VAIADMFLKMDGVTGEATDSAHKGEIDVVSWSWGMQAPIEMVSGQATGATTLTELNVVKRVDRASPTLMTFLRNHKVLGAAVLTVRKAGTSPFEYFKIELANVRVTSLKAEVVRAEEAELVERVSLGFSKVTVSYTPQGATGGSGGGTNVFEADAHSGK
jgi:type VI secretion system secreted protein Hcp